MSLRVEIETSRRNKIAPLIDSSTSQDISDAEIDDDLKELELLEQRLQTIASQSGLTSMLEEAREALINTGILGDPDVLSELEEEAHLKITLSWKEPESFYEEHSSTISYIRLDVFENGDIGFHQPVSYWDNLFGHPKLIHQRQWAQDRSILEKNVLKAIQNPDSHTTYYETGPRPGQPW